MFTALLDTCVLVPSTQRDVLLECASTGIYRPVWSQAILDELAYTLTRLLTLKGRTTDEVNAYVTRLRNQMGNAFPDALTTGWDHLLPTITIPDPDDTHVVAAALTAGAQVIVTNDRRGFTTGLPPGLATQHPDDFLLDALDLAPTAVLAAVHAVAARTGRHGPAHSPRDLLEHLSKTGTPAFAATVLDQLTRSG